MGIIKRQGIKNTLITYTGILIGAVNVIFVQPRLLTTEELGFTRLLFDLAYLAGLIMPLGLPNIIVKYFPFYKDNKGHRGFAGFLLGFSLVGFAAGIGTFMLFRDQLAEIYRGGGELFSTYFGFLIPFAVIMSSISITTAYCQALFKSTVPSFLNDVFVRIGTMLLTIAYFNRWMDFEGYVMCFIGIYAVELLIILFFIFLVDRPRIRPEPILTARETVVPMLRFGLLLCVASFASYALRRVDVMILGTKDLGDVAIYSTAVYIAAFIEVPLTALDRISHTKVASNFANNSLREIGTIYSESVRYLLLAGGLLFVGINSCTYALYEFVRLPGEYSSYVTIVYLVAAGSLINVATGVNSSIMFYSRHFVLATVLMLVSLAVTAALNLLLIPRYGLFGAAYASIGGSFIYNAIKYVFIFRRLGFQPYNVSSLKILAIIVVCTILGHLLPNSSDHHLLSLLYKGAIVTVLYLLLAYKWNVAPQLFSSGIGKVRSFFSKQPTS